MTRIRVGARTEWPHPVTPEQLRRSRWTFKADYEDTLAKLDYELEAIGADDALIEAAMDPRYVRKDGSAFHANAPQPAHPGISLTVRTETGVRVFATDVCETWQHNLRSIALGLEALRAVARYGITPRGEQYAGFLAIESGRPAAMTAEDAARLLIDLSGGFPDDAPQHLPAVIADPGRVIADPALRRSLYRQAAANHHPDKGGDSAVFVRLGEAMALLNGATS